MIEAEPEFPAPKGETVGWRAIPPGRQMEWRTPKRQIAFGAARPTADQRAVVIPLLGRLTISASPKAGLAQAVRRAAVAVSSASLMSRLALHLVVVLLAVGVVAFARVQIPEIDVSLPVPPLAPEAEQGTLDTPQLSRGGGQAGRTSAALLAAPVFHTTIPERERTEVITHTVQVGENMWAIAQAYGLNVETLLWANPEMEKDPQLLSVDQQLLIPPVDGIYYTVKAGDTVAKLAKTFQTTVDKITGYRPNGLQQPYTLVAGQRLMIPDGRKPIAPYNPPNLYPMTRVGSAPAGAATGSGRFAWPTQGYLSQRFWSRHLGIDIANRIGAPVVAADAGYVLAAGVDTYGYGRQVVIDHGNGFLTRYAHLDTILVTAGQSVQKNEKIGTMGNTGRSTGPHLHFEIIQNGTHRDPLAYLPK